MVKSIEAVGDGGSTLLLKHGRVSILQHKSWERERELLPSLPGQMLECANSQKNYCSTRWNNILNQVLLPFKSWILQVVSSLMSLCYKICSLGMFDIAHFNIIRNKHIIYKICKIKLAIPPNTPSLIEFSYAWPFSALGHGLLLIHSTCSVNAL